MFDMSSGPSVQQATLRFDHHCTPTRCPRRPGLRITCPQGRDDDDRRHGDLRIRPNRPGPSRTDRRLEIDLALNRSVHRLDEVSRSLSPEDGVGSVVEVVEQVLDLGAGVERVVAVVFQVLVAPVQRP